MTRYELHYATGGHGGPYQTLEEAISAARRLICGNPNEYRIDVRREVAGPIVATVAYTNYRGLQTFIRE